MLLRYLHHAPAQDGESCEWRYDMKLAEALALRADLQKRLAPVQQRAVANARVQGGENPSGDPRTLVAEFERMATELTGLVRRINRTTLASQLADGRTLTDAIAERDSLKLRHSFYSALAHAGSARQDRAWRSELKFVATVNVVAMQ